MEEQEAKYFSDQMFFENVKEILAQALIPVSLCVCVCLSIYTRL